MEPTATSSSYTGLPILRFDGTWLVMYPGCAMRTVNASEFKTRCLTLLDEVTATREPVTILKRGRPVAQLTPVLSRDEGYPQDELRGSVQEWQDIESSVLPASAWETASEAAQGV